MRKTWLIALVLGINICWFGTAPAADFDGDSRSDIAVFRPGSGLWAVRGYTRIYFGSSGDIIVPGDYDGDGLDDVAVFRASSGLWAVRGVTREYFGTSGDKPVPGGGGQKIYDYVVKPGDGDDLVQALESTTYKSVYIPASTYNVSEDITVSSVERITGEANFASIDFTGYQSLIINKAYCIVEGIRVRYGGYSLSGEGNFILTATM